MNQATKDELQRLCESAAGDTRWDMTTLDELVEGSKLQRFVAHGALLVVWHGGATFNVYNPTTCDAVTCFTVYGDDRGNPIQRIDEAAAAIDRWYQNLDDDFAW